MFLSACQSGSFYGIMLSCELLLCGLVLLILTIIPLFEEQFTILFFKKLGKWWNHKLKGKNKKHSGVLKISELRGMPWGKVIKSVYFQQIEFPQNYWYEDSVMAQILYHLVNPDKVYGIEEIIYYYNINSESISVKGKKNKKCIDSLWITLQLFNDRKKMGLEKNIPYYEYMLRMSILSYRRIFFMPPFVKKCFFIIYSDFIIKEFRNFHSGKYFELEKAIKGKNYLLFKILCLER